MALLGVRLKTVTRTISGLFAVAVLLSICLVVAPNQKPIPASAATLPSASDPVGTRYSSPKIPYTDTAKGFQGYRLTTWGKTLHKNITLGHTGSQDTTQWSADSTKITFTMSFNSVFGTGAGGVFVYDLNTEQITLIAKDANNRGSAFNHANSSEVLYWKRLPAGLALTAVNINTFSERQIILLPGAQDAGTPAQSWDAQGRWVHTWVAGRGGVSDEFVQSVVVDTLSGQTHPAFPYRPDLVLTVGAGAEHDLYRDSAIWNPVHTSVAAVVQQSPLSDLGINGRKYVLYDFSNNTSRDSRKSPAHSTWTADGEYFVTNYGVFAFSNWSCVDIDGNCSSAPNDPAPAGGFYGVSGLSYGRLDVTERSRGINQRFVVMPYNGRFQEITVNIVTTMRSGLWQGNPQYTIGYSFNTEAGPGTKLADSRRQYSPNGEWLLWRSNLRNRNFQAPPGLDDGDEQTTDLFMLRVGEAGVPLPSGTTAGGTTGVTTGVTTGPIPLPSVPCEERYHFNVIIPSGYGAAHNVFDTSLAPPDILSFECNGTGAVLSATSSDATHPMYVYKNAYRWTGTAWTPITLSGTPVANAPEWLTGGSLTFQGNVLRQYPNYNFIAAYTCTFVNGAWKCGCRDSNCLINLWQLQALRLASNPGGGTTVTQPPTTSPPPNFPAGGPFFGVFGAASGLSDLVPTRLKLYYTARDTWADIENPTYQMGEMRQNMTANLRSVFSVALIPRSEAQPNRSQLTKCANGEYNGHFTTLANNLESRGINNIIIRAGWEWTINSYPWAIGHNIAFAPAFAQCYKNFVTSVDAAFPTNQFLYDWNPNSGLNAQMLTAAWPGDQYVDIVGLDIYDVYQDPNNCPNKVTGRDDCRWASQLNILNIVKNFAAQHGKPMSIPEWAVKDSTVCGDACGGGAGGGDDPFFVQKMCEFMQTPGNNVVYHIYFDQVNENGDQTLRTTSHPQSRAAFIQFCRPNSSNPNTSWQ